MSSTANRDSGCVVRSYLIHSLPQGVEVHEAASPVGVHHEQPLAARMKHAVSHGASLAQVVLQAYDADVRVWVLCCQLEGCLGSTVGRAVVDDQDLVGELEWCRAQVVDGGSEHVRQTFRLIKCRNYDRKVNRARVGERWEGQRLLRRLARPVLLLGVVRDNSRGRPDDKQHVELWVVRKRRVNTREVRGDQYTST